MIHDDVTRREFIHGATATAALALGTSTGVKAAVTQEPQAKSRVPVVIASANGVGAVDRAMQHLQSGGRPMDAVVKGVNVVEEDPNDDSVGLGGLPNEDGVVELDACCMDGKTHRAGGVAALRNIIHASSVAQRVLERTDHVLIVGEGALRFARAHGFKETNLLTEKARENWLRWKENLSDKDDWLPPADHKKKADAGITYTTGTINCCAVDASSNIAGVTTTSGLSYKIPGRVGDSPIIGAGLYVDNEVGAAGSTGRGEANLQNCSSFMVVEFMRQGKSPEEACLAVLKRVAAHSPPRLCDKNGRPNFGLKFYAVAKDGRYGSASMWSGAHFAVHDGRGPRKEKAAFLFDRKLRVKR